ncbi:NUDIX hydrolase [Patescibacteria group bacterium]|nr:NUDIX hydrolase [Patescibacteria group bacterium]MBU1754956.1 NUDIX hydrolase [Patescibacteria group bacterium]
MEISTSFPDSFHRVTIKGLCVRDGKILLVKESTELSGKWELPGGGLDFGENIRAGFEREIREEMGLTVSKMSKSPVYVWTHKYEHQRNLDWYYAFVVAYRVEFENLDITPTPECQEIQFFSAEELEALNLGGQVQHLPKHFNAADFLGGIDG